MPGRLLILMILTLAVFGCSSGGGMDVTAPEEPVGKSSAGSSHFIWGLWQFTADPVAGTLDVVPVRMAEMHLNAIPFLEPPALLNLTLETIEFNGDIIDADIGLRHPFLGLNEFSGFDVCGILISNGSITGFDDSDLRMAGDGDTRLLNADGYARWWNPAEFPVNPGTIFGYNDGLLGAPDSFADYNCTLNGYKYFCDDLDDPTDPMSDVTIANRGLFSAGQKNVRHYTIELGAEGLIFNYAIDANWQFPRGDPPWEAPGDFAPEANRPEAWRIEVTETDNSLYYENPQFGGGISLSIDVYDWYNADENLVRVEAPGVVVMTETSTATGGGAGYSTYEIDITGCTPSAAGDLDLLITIESDDVDYGGLLTGETVSAYFVHTTEVSGEAPVIDPWSEEFIVAGSGGRFPVIAQSPSGHVIAGWSTDPGIGWSEFTFPYSWASPEVVDSSNDMAWMSIDSGFSGDDIYLHGGIYAGTTNVNGTTFEIGHGKTWRWDGGTGWEFWNMNSGTALHTHYYNCFENKHHILHGTYASYGFPMHIQWTSWGQYYADYFQDYYDGSNMHEYGYSRCWDDDSNGHMYATFESDRMKGIFLPKIDYRYVKIAVQFLPSTDSGDHAHYTVDAGDNDYLDSPVVAIDSNDVVHVAYRRYIDSTGTWQVVHRWSLNGSSWGPAQETVVWSGEFEPEWRYISLDIDSMDRIHLTFKVQSKIWYARSSNGTDWLDLEWVNESSEGLIDSADYQQWMFVDKDDQVHVIWMRKMVIPTIEFGTLYHRWRLAVP